MATAQENALNGHNKGGLLGKMKGLMATKHFGEKKGERAARKKRSKMSGNELFS